jgi:hypothetical protein
MQKNGIGGAGSARKVPRDLERAADLEVANIVKAGIPVGGHLLVYIPLPGGGKKSLDAPGESLSAARAYVRQQLVATMATA